MLVAGVNDRTESLGRVADFLARLGPRKAYISIPTRPPAEGWVRAPGGAAIAAARRILMRTCPEVELLTAFEGVAFGTTGRTAEDILAVAAVHPIREDAVQAILKQFGADWSLVESLLAEGLLEEVKHVDRRYFRRRQKAESGGGPG
jgi:wyosine [tRNA(Phe)-imidazoG37] synthetase (radical SAM superfamily)